MLGRVGLWKRHSDFPHSEALNAVGNAVFGLGLNMQKRHKWNKEMNQRRGKCFRKVHVRTALEYRQWFLQTRYKKRKYWNSVIPSAEQNFPSPPKRIWRWYLLDNTSVSKRRRKLTEESNMCIYTLRIAREPAVFWKEGKATLLSKTGFKEHRKRKALCYLC